MTDHIRRETSKNELIVEPIVPKGTDPRAAPLLVREVPNMVKRDTLLTDGTTGFKVIDEHFEHSSGRRKIRLVNIDHPELSDQRPHYGWFDIDDIGELAFGKGERREEREDFS